MTEKQIEADPGFDEHLEAEWENFSKLINEDAPQESAEISAENETVAGLLTALPRSASRSSQSSGSDSDSQSDSSADSHTKKLQRNRGSSQSSAEGEQRKTNKDRTGSQDGDEEQIIESNKRTLSRESHASSDSDLSSQEEDNAKPKPHIRVEKRSSTSPKRMRLSAGDELGAAHQSNPPVEAKDIGKAYGKVRPKDGRLKKKPSDRSHYRRHRSRSREHRHHGQSRSHSPHHHSRAKHTFKSGRHQTHHRRGGSRERKRRGSHRHSRSRRSRSTSAERRQGRNKLRRSRSGSRSRKHEVKFRDPMPPASTANRKNEPLTFKEKLRQSFLEMHKQAMEGKLDVGGLDSKSNEKPSNLPLKNLNPLLALAQASGEKMTPQTALMHTMAAMHQKAQELTGVALPKYYNPAAVNPLKYAEQVVKRKLLWSKTKDPLMQRKEETEMSDIAGPAHAPAATTWNATSFSHDEDGKVTAKFRKLMGIKPGEETINKEVDDKTIELQRKQEELFQNLDKEYEFARMTTHTQRGVGFGYPSQGPVFPK